MPNFEDILNEIIQIKSDANRAAEGAFDEVRRNHLRNLSEYTDRNTIAYYSGWQQKSSISGVEIRDEDRDGFMRALHKLDYSKGLDLILHTPGGSIAALSLLYYI